MDMIPRWFPTARLNFARNLLRYRDDHPAIIYESKRSHVPLPRERPLSIALAN